MAALSEGAARKWARTELASYEVTANAQIWKGGAVKVAATGEATALTAGVGHRFGGFAIEDVKGGATDGAVRVNVYRAGVVELNVDSADAGDLNKPVYARTDNDFYKTSASNAVKVGVIVEWVSGTTCKVQFDANAKALAA